MQFYLSKPAPVLREDEQGVLLYAVASLSETCLRKPPLQGTERLHVVIGKLHAAYPLRRGRYQHVAERCRGEAVVDA